LIDIYIHENSFLIFSNFFQKDKFKTHEENYLKIIQELIQNLDEEEQG